MKRHKLSLKNILVTIETNERFCVVDDDMHVEREIVFSRLFTPPQTLNSYQRQGRGQAVFVINQNPLTIYSGLCVCML